MSNRFALFVWCCLLSLVHCDVIFNTTRISSPKDGLSLMEAGSDLYFVGGFEFHDSIATDTIEVFDLINRTWSEQLNLPFKRGYVTPVAVGKSLYFVGGYSYSNPPFVFDQERQDFVTDHGQGPTVFRATSISLHESILTVVGSYSVDFLDLQTKQWNYSVELTQIKMNLFNSITFAYEDIVVVIGGTNVTTLEDSLSAWLYNRTTDTLITFQNAITASSTSNDAQFSVANQIISVWTADMIYLHRLGSSEWHEPVRLLRHVDVMLSTPMTTFMINSGAYQQFLWTNMTTTEYATFDPFEMYAFAVDGYVAYIDSGRLGITVYYYDDASYSWVPSQSITEVTTFNEVTSSVTVGEWACLATTNQVLAVNIRQRTHSVASTFTQVDNLMVGNNSCHFIDLGPPARRHHFDFSQGSYAVLVDDEEVTLQASPVAIVGNNFFTTNGGVFYGTVTNENFNQSSELRSDHLWTSNDQHFVMMTLFDQASVTTARQYYNKVDIYDLDSQTWLNSTNMPFTEYNQDWHLPAAALGDNLVVWSNQSIAVYDPLTGNWTQSQNFPLGALNNGRSLLNAHIPVLTLNDTAYLRTLFGSFTKHRASDPFDWTETTRAPLPANTLFVQYLYIGNKQIFISSRDSDGSFGLRFATIYLYDIEKDTYQTSLVPRIDNALSEDLTMVRVGDFVVCFSTSPTQILYYEIPTTSWYTQNYTSSVKFSSVYQTTTGLSVVVGGRDDNRGSTYSNAMLLFEADSISAPPASPTASNRTDGPSPPTGLSEGGLIAAIVVPVGAALIAGALLLILLLLRKKRRQKKGGAMSMTGLASKYGQWFIPFDQIKFGDQIGRGASGQVFKGSWNGTSVALKVSMTQANSTVIGELEMMIQMRPHPNVVQLFGFSVHPETDSIILVIEFCDGGSLDDLLFDSKQQMSSEQKTLLLLGVAKGLNHLHSNNIVHRDVASRNVLLHKNEPKLTDFGMSRLIDEDTQRGTTKSELGPIRWMSPESLRNKEYSTKSDMWSFGILMYEVIAQQEPHLNADPIEIGRLIRDNGLTPVIPESCPNKLADIMRSCWNVNPAGRPTIEEIIEQLEAQ